ncbi:MAG: hypothetical protein ACI8P0_004012, partial [Planctomycetaceae bacterium]
TSVRIVASGSGVIDRGATVTSPVDCNLELPARREQTRE